jgi:hypothetical protein
MPLPRGTSRVLWFVGLWGAGVLVLGIIAYAIRLALGM